MKNVTGTVLRRPSAQGGGFQPAKVLAVDLADGLADHDAPDYTDALVLVKHRGRPLGCVHVACREGRLRAEDVREAVSRDEAVGARLRRQLVRQRLLGEATAPAPALSWSIIVCTRDRLEHLRYGLAELASMLRPGGEVIIVDNDPPDEATRRLVASYPQVRYVREPRRGLNAARMTGARAATGEILLYTDDDVVIDPQWIPAMLEPFSGARVGAVTGLTLPLELETPAQALFEYYSGHGRGFQRRVFDHAVVKPAGAGQVGSGANMAFRRELVLRLGLFEPELDMGSVARTGGDAHAFYQVLANGYQIVYTPAALVWHRHRREYDALRRMLHDYNVGGVAHLTRCLVHYGDWGALYVAAWWLRHHHLKQLYRGLRRKRDALPVGLTLSELAGFLAGPAAYLKARRIEQARGLLNGPARGGGSR